MVLAIILNDERDEEVKLYWNRVDFLREQYSGNVIEFVDLTVRGKRFRDKQQCLREIAYAAKRIQFSECCLDAVWWLADEMQDYFWKMGKRYGLLRELREMCLI